ncbi:MAG: DUF5011 domain-containing protein, partial [Opitutae bacterium]
AESATEYGLFSDASLAPLPEGGEPIPSDYQIARLTYDQVLLGSEIANGGFGNGNAYASAKLAWTGEDLELPVITLIGAAEVSIPLGKPFNDPGATASDNIDGDLTSQILSDASGVVDILTAGTYTVTYSVRDAAGNRATAVRKVIVESAPSVEISAIRVIGNDMLATILVEGQAEEYDHWHYQLDQALSVSGPAGGTRGEPGSQLLLSGLPLGEYELHVGLVDSEGELVGLPVSTAFRVDRVLVPRISISFGSIIEDQNGTLFSDELGKPFGLTNPGGIAVGYFLETFDVEANAHDVPALIANFQILSSASFAELSQDSPGFLTFTDQVPESEEATGRHPYLMVVAGTSDVSNLSTATEFALFTDTSLPAIPAGAKPVLSELNLARQTYDKFLLGNFEDGEGLGEGSAFRTQSIYGFGGANAPDSMVGKSLFRKDPSRGPVTLTVDSTNSVTERVITQGTSVQFTSSYRKTGRRTGELSLTRDDGSSLTLEMDFKTLDEVRYTLSEMDSKGNPSGTPTIYSAKLAPKELFAHHQVNYSSQIPAKLSVTRDHTQSFVGVPAYSLTLDNQVDLHYDQTGNFVREDNPWLITSGLAFLPDASGWGDSGTFSPIEDSIYATSDASGSQSAGSAFSQLINRENSEFFTFGFYGTDPASLNNEINELNLGSTDLSAGTEVTLAFEYKNGPLRYVILNGANLKGYHHQRPRQGSLGQIRLTFETVDPPGSKSDPDGSSISSSIGLHIQLGGEHDYQGALFLTDLLWTDLDEPRHTDPLDPVAAFNVSAMDGEEAAFAAYLPMQLMRRFNIAEPWKIRAALKTASDGKVHFIAGSMEGVSDEFGKDFVREVFIKEAPEQGADRIPPNITLSGAQLLKIPVGGIFTDPGATAHDNADGDLTDQIKISGDQVDTSLAGSFQISYNVTDSAGNEAREAIRTVIVEEPDPSTLDSIRPVIFLQGSLNLELQVGQPYI